VEIPHAAANHRRPCDRSSEKSLVATPLQAKPSPAATIVSDAAGRRTLLTTYGSSVNSPSPTSTSVTTRSLVCAVLRFGAVAAMPATPTTIAPIARCSRRPARSPSMRSPKNSSTSRPIAIVGCTITSDTSSSATTCSGQPSIDRPVPASQRARRNRLRASAGCRCSVCGVRLASIACSATPRL
jgi:hypothetical protein